MGVVVIAHQVVWTDLLTEKVIKYGALSELDANILRTRARGYTVSQQSEMFNCSERTIARRVAFIKKVYDAIQKEYPDELPIRKTCKIELYMDEN